MKPILSVIVPVYNVEKYLDRCMESLVHQSLSNIEIILVDDGAKDSSGKMCDLWKAKDHRVKVIHKQNQGLGYARNSGIDIATGEFIAYVDSDDYVECDAFKNIVDRLKDTQTDVCYFGCVDVWSDRKRYGIPPQKLFYSSEETVEYVKAILGPAPESTEFLFGGVSAWSGVVRRELLEKYCIRFPSERECLCEDVFYNIQVCIHAQSIAIEPTCLYCYCHNDNSSLTSRYRKDRFEAACRMYYELNRITNSSNDKEVNERVYRAFLQNIIVCIKQEVGYKKQNGIKAMIYNLKGICKNDLVRDAMREYPINKMPYKQRLLFNAVKTCNIMLIVLLMEIRLRKWENIEGKWKSRT